MTRSKRKLEDDLLCKKRTASEEKEQKRTAPGEICQVAAFHLRAFTNLYKVLFTETAP